MFKWEERIPKVSNVCKVRLPGFVILFLFSFILCFSIFFCMCMWSRGRRRTGMRQERGAGCVTAGDQEADRRKVQALTCVHPSRRCSGLAGRSIPLYGGSHEEMAPRLRATQIFSWLRKPPARGRSGWQRRLGCDRKDGGVH